MRPGCGGAVAFITSAMAMEQLKQLFADAVPVRCQYPFGLIADAGSFAAAGNGVVVLLQLRVKKRHIALATLNDFGAGISQLFSPDIQTGLVRALQQMVALFENPVV